MTLIGILTLIFNIIAIAILAFGLFHTFEHPKNKAIYGYTIAGSCIPYLILLTIFVILEILQGNYKFSCLLFCVISPFIIGKLVKYETLKFYTAIQILCFVISAVVLIIKYF